MDIMEIITGSNQQRATFCAPICQKKWKLKEFLSMWSIITNMYVIYNALKMKTNMWKSLLDNAPNY